MYKVLFRLDSGGRYGLGHFMRCKALADALHELGLSCVFAVQQIHSEQAVYPHQLLLLDDEQQFLLQAEYYDAVIIDHYDYESAMFYALSLLSAKLIVLDDECNRGFLYADIIINSLNRATCFNYKTLAPEAKLLSGSDYVLLGQYFSSQNCLDYNHRKNIVITFGGSDVTDLTLPVVELIHNTPLSENCLVVTGAGCQNAAEIKDYCRQHHIDYRHDIKNMAAVFAEAKLAISAAGSTAFELASCGVPSLLAVVADNQLLSAREQSQAGWCEMVDCRVENQPRIIVDKAVNMINHAPLLSMSQKAQSVVDGKGAARVAERIKTLLK